jgi:hypothetical protein
MVKRARWAMGDCRGRAGVVRGGGGEEELVGGSHGVSLARGEAGHQWKTR